MKFYSIFWCFSFMKVIHVKLYGLINYLSDKRGHIGMFEVYR